MPVLCRFIECIKAWRQKLIDCNFQELVFDEEMGMLLDQVLVGVPPCFFPSPLSLS